MKPKEEAYTIDDLIDKVKTYNNNHSELKKKISAFTISKALMLSTLLLQTPLLMIIIS